ncbi:hypothetical protein [uncultured Chitinophaga sp.]|uniref:hypothetical protein n=1 Tax=uncultured Chitinophaga sp. TaxID=339340 RepID=UPI00262A46FB|nr:hypothetical protein [uncultured Chitinophaga sp.]
MAPFALQSQEQGTVTGITIAAGSDTAMSSGLSNLYCEGGINIGVVGEMPSYDFTNITFNAPFSGRLRQRTNSQGMVFVTIEVFMG